MWNGKINPGKVFDLTAAQSRRCCVPKVLCAYLKFQGRTQNDHVVERRTSQDRRGR